MGTAPAEESNSGIAPHGLVRFTQRGEEALDALVTDLAATCDGSPESITQLLERVLQADIGDLANSLAAVADPTEDLATDADLARTPETPDEAARRRLGRHQDDLPPVDGTQPSRSFDR